MSRTPAEIRSSIEATRNELAVSLGQFRGELDRITDWRLQLARHRRTAVVAAATAGFVIGGGLAVFSRRR